MRQSNYNKAAGFIFLFVSLAHLMRAVGGWEIEINGNMIPLWTSWLVVVVGGYLAFRGLFGSNS